MSKFRYDDEQNKDSLSIASILGEYWANEENWQYGDNTDIQVVMEEGVPMAYLLDAAASTYRKLEIQL